MASTPAVSSGVATVDVLAALPVPADLSDAQRDGHICVWGGESLTPATAIDLGPRRVDGEMASPRACKADVSRAAQEALYAHVKDIERCTGTETCGTCRGLYRVIRLGQR
ncbi:hypothetical protein AB0E25_33605 [Streptomyces bobili]|uniref:hypothetical protein n=1 Tax=Streptomyces bobili TaxID=67280 RepID=UPI0033E5AB8F